MRSTEESGVPPLSEYYEFRSRLVDSLTADLVGPAEPEETIEDAPIQRYTAGILYPQSSETISPVNDVDVSDDDDDASIADPPVALANVRYPSSMGISFAVDTT